MVVKTAKLVGENPISAQNSRGQAFAVQLEGMLSNPGRLNQLTEAIIRCAILVHKTLGAGLLESVYAACLAIELAQAGLRYEPGRVVPIVYQGHLIDANDKADLIVENLVLVELKAVETIASIHKPQTLTYLKLTGLPVGLLINFNVPLLRDGLRRLVNPMSGASVNSEN
jgi:GxxExxY protein